MKPVALQLYSVREQAKEDLAKVLEAVADMGYKGVEPAGLHGKTPGAFQRLVSACGMRITSSHGPWAKPDNLEEVIDTAQALDIDLVATGFGPDQFQSRAAIEEAARSVASMAETLANAGLTLFVHNHYWEFAQVEGRLAYDWFLDICGPRVMFQIDAYWAANHGANDPVQMVRKFADRLPLLHLKDGPLTKEDPMTPVGTGKMDIAGVIEACDEDVLEWVIVELDRCDMDMMEAVKKSYDYLVSNGLAEGNC